MKRQMAVDRDEFNSIFTEYGRRKLLTYADSIRELAESFKDSENSRERMPGEFDSDRRDYIWQKRLCENKELMVEM